MEKSGFISVEDVYEEFIIEQFIDEKELNAESATQQLIQDILKEGQDVIVQVIKEPVSTKGAKLTSYIGIPGKYLVLLGTVDLVGISRKIEDAQERSRLYETIKRYKPKDIGFIARTSSVDIDTQEIRSEIKQLNSLWKRIKKKFDKADKPILLYEEPKIYLKVTRDLINKNLTKVIVDSEKVLKDIKKHYSSAISKNTFNLELYNEAEPIFHHFNIETKINRIYQKKVWLKSGGHLIIDEAEGLTVIDVNTGKFISEGDQEETILKINKEAIAESARQIRLRNLVGIIVIDLIDLKSKKYREELFQLFSDEIKKDRARTVLQDISSFCVVQLTRQRIRESVLSNLVEPCYLCKGTGKLKSVYSICYEILRDLNYKSKINTGKTLTVYCSKEIIDKLRKIERKNLKKIERENNTKIKFKKTNDFIEIYTIVISEE
ncbi:MAG: Rne/Rng family ribonuclease [Candidatus Dadabacteria bacterium]|nr:Rne/Rng family ribonuclease [Candidatus Dadabacteria bacterium]NIQ14179.1 Rne/Rng family ribonuclease [Candidatus Dadabacteria bacterium]